jgi:hypothetical protein
LFEKSSIEIKEKYSGVYGRPHTYLAISGGGDNGAFAAGLLLGWTEAGDRPEFTMVTGTSAGALVAPLAFLGPDYDPVLRKVTASLTADQVFEKRRTLNGIRRDALASTEPLARLIASYVDQEMIEKIAAEHRRGRRLNIGTANLDSMRPVIWRLGAIANSGHPRALEYIRKVILASASIPGQFPPVLLDVEVGQERFDELHVDGGATAQVFLYPPAMVWEKVLEALEIPGRPKAYVIRNARLDPMYQEVDDRFFPIVSRSIECLIRAQGIGDLFRVYLETCRDGIDFNLAYIPADFTETEEDEFDPVYMKKLAAVAFELAKAGYPWEKVPPELKGTHIECQ